MYADELEVCPHCEATRFTELSERRNRLRNQYGTLNPGIWTELIENLEKDELKALPETYCKQYTVIGLAHREIEVQCAGNCTECGVHDLDSYHVSLADDLRLEVA